MVRMRTISNQSRYDKREPRTDISQVELQLHGLRDAPRRGLHQLRREDRGADPRVRPRRVRHRAVLGCLPRGDRVVLLHATRALARAASALGIGRGHGRAGRPAVAMDPGLWPARRPLADLRLQLTREAAIAAFAKSWNDRLRPLQQPPIGIGSSLEEPAPVSLVTHKGGSNAEVMALHHCPRDPWVSRWLSRGCNGPN